MLSILQELGIKHKTDKEGDHPIHGEGHRFCAFYDYHLSSLRFDELKIFEIGIFDGASLKMWEEYFPNSQIFGIDLLIDPRAKLINEGRIFSYRLDAGDKEALSNFLNNYGPFDIIIDDGSHFTDHQWLSWDLFSNNCKIFIWEDLHSSRLSPYMREKRDNMYPLDFAKKLSEEDPNKYYLFDRDSNEKHVTFLKKNFLIEK